MMLNMSEQYEWGLLLVSLMNEWLCYYKNYVVLEYALSLKGMPERFDSILLLLQPKKVRECKDFFCVK